MLSQTTFMGRLTADPELRYTPTGVPVASFTLAQDVWRNGEKKKARFIPCKVWRGWAERLVKTARKGSVLVVSGELDFEQWETEGQKRSRALVNASECYHVELVFPPKDGESDDDTPVGVRSADDTAAPVGDDSDIPF